MTAGDVIIGIILIWVAAFIIAKIVETVSDLLFVAWPSVLGLGIAIAASIALHRATGNAAISVVAFIVTMLLTGFAQEGWSNRHPR